MATGMSALPRIADAASLRAGAAPSSAQPSSGPAAARLRAAWPALASRATGLWLPLALLALAEFAARAGWVAPHLFPPPSSLWATAAELLDHGLAGHVGASTARVAAGFATGALLALALGAAVGLSPRIERLLDPTLQALRAIPSLAWVPLLLLWLGIDEAPKLTLIAIGAFFPVYMGVVSGFRDVDRKLVEVASMAGLGPLALVRRVLLPAALPSVWTGLRNGLGLAWMFMVAAELIAASRGVGYLLTDGRETGRADIVLTAIVLLALLGQASDGAMRWAGQRLLRWRDTYTGAA